MATATTTRNGESNGPLATAHRIVKIVAESNGKRGRPGETFSFHVTVSDGSGKRLTDRFSAGELMTFPKFRQALLTRHGCWFEGGEYEGRRGKENWSHDIAELRKAGNDA